MKTIFREAAVILAISFLGATLCAFFYPKRPTWHQVQSEDVKRWSINEAKARQVIAQGNVLWVDARPEEKFAKDHYPGAISLDLANWAQLVISQQSILQDAMGRSVIVYCDGTRCEKSKDVATRLREFFGLEPVYLLKGNWRKLVPKS